MEAPHFGRVFERMIRSVKRAVNAVLGNSDVTDGELQTIFTGVESLINFRPSKLLSSNPNDEPVLTPNHFLMEHFSTGISKLKCVQYYNFATFYEFVQVLTTFKESRHLCLVTRAIRHFVVIGQ